MGVEDEGRREGERIARGGETTQSLKATSTIQSVAELEDTPAPGWNASGPVPLPVPVVPVPEILKAKIAVPLPSPLPGSSASTMAKEKPSVEGGWNTSRLGLRVGADALSAASAAVLVAPIITMIDKGIIENASGRNSLGQSLRASAREMVTRPHRFVGSRPFALIFSLYFGTYMTANSIDTASATLKPSPVSTTTSGAPKFLATSSANLALCLYKDSQFTRLFGAATPTPRPVPPPTFLLFAARDCLTVFASFNLPPLLAPHIAASPYFSERIRSIASAPSIAQFVAPAAIQLVSTPLHLLGLDLYNRPDVKDVSSRASRVVRDWAKSAAARVCRVVPAFGVGGVVNAKVRKELMGRLE